MTQGSNLPAPARVADCVLIAIANASRASAVRTLALEFCPNVVLVRDGHDAVEQLDRLGPPRLVITALSLPRVDGFGVLRHLRKIPGGARTPAIALSSHDALRVIATKLADSLG